MASAYEKASRGWRRSRRGYVRASPYHRWLKHGRNRLVRRMARAALKQGTEPPQKVGYRGWES